MGRNLFGRFLLNMGNFKVLICKLFSVLLMLYGFVANGLFAQNDEDRLKMGVNSSAISRLDNPKQLFVNSIINWNTYQIDIYLSVMLENIQLQTRYYVNEVVENHFSVWLYDSLKNVQLNSQQTLNDFWGKDVLKNPNTMFSKILKKKYSFLAADLNEFQLAYQVDIYPEMIKIWIDEDFESRALPAAILNKNPTEFSGLIIYVSDDLQLRGEPYRTPRLQPALFPRVYDEDLNLVLSYHNVAKDVLLERGMAVYDTAKNFDTHKNLLGSYPLRISAKELFGMDQTDLIIRNSDASRLLKNPYLRNILVQGRILILLESASSNILYKDR